MTKPKSKSINIQVRMPITDAATILEYMNAKINQDGQPYTVVKKGTCLRYALQLFAQDWLKGKHEYIEDDDRALEVLADIYGSQGGDGVDVMSRLQDAVEGDIGKNKE